MGKTAKKEGIKVDKKEPKTVGQWILKKINTQSWVLEKAEVSNTIIMVQKILPEEKIVFLK